MRAVVWSRHTMLAPVELTSMFSTRLSRFVLVSVHRLCTRSRPVLDGVSQTLTNGLDLKPNALALLEVVDDLEQIAGLRIAARPEHAHQALWRLAG